MGSSSIRWQLCLLAYGLIAVVEAPCQRHPSASPYHAINTSSPFRPGVYLRPAPNFPADWASCEVFTNAAEGLAEMSPTLLNKYLAAAKDLADHAVLLPDGFRFSAGKTRRDWTNEGTA